MRFSLTYSGPLPAKGSSQDKEKIRQALHPQLRELWTHDPLSTHSEYLEPKQPNKISVLTIQGSRTFAPLITSKLRLTAGLDILMLRPERPGGIVTSGGDIDNKLKTLLDAIGIPTLQQEQQLVQSTPSNEDVVFTLLEDDQLITRINIETDRLLSAPQPDHVELIIRVTTRARQLIYGNIGLIA